MILEIKGVCFGYRDRPVGRDLDLVLRAGECACLLGPNGCGKTTLLKTVLGLQKPLSGHLFLDGRDLGELTPAQLARTMGYVPQTHGRYYPFTVFEMVLMGRSSHLSPFGSPGAKDVDAALRSLDSLGLGYLRDRNVTELSAGQSQLVLIARALAQEPQLLVLDEPTASLDFGNQIRLMRHLRSLSQQGLGITFSTHDPGHAFLCGDRTILMRAGRIVADGPPITTLTSENLSALYGVEMTVVGADELPRLPSGTRVCLAVGTSRDAAESPGGIDDPPRTTDGLKC